MLTPLGIVNIQVNVIYIITVSPDLWHKRHILFHPAEHKTYCIFILCIKSECLGNSSQFLSSGNKKDDTTSAGKTMSGSEILQSFS